MEHVNAVSTRQRRQRPEVPAEIAHQHQRLPGAAEGVAPHDDLLVHELCHVWQMQHLPVRMPLSYLLSGYASNRFELEAQAAVAATLE